MSLLPEAERAAITALLELESEPATKLLEENAYQETILRNRVNEAGKAVMLAFALDGDLDQLGANVNVARLTITPANPNALPPVAAVMEDNDAYRLRIQEVLDGLSVAGPKASYEFHARSSDGRRQGRERHQPGAGPASPSRCWPTTTPASPTPRCWPSWRARSTPRKCAPWATA